ncbi:MAG: hypothetical protein AAF628_00535 [Planctomycetota bacterium]
MAVALVIAAAAALMRPRPGRPDASRPANGSTAIASGNVEARLPTPTPPLGGTAAHPAAVAGREHLEPLLASGRVVDDLGHAVTGFSLRSMAIPEPAPPLEEPLFETPNSLDPPWGFARKEWDDDVGPRTIEFFASEALSAVDAGNGRFEVRGHTEAPWVSLVARRGGRTVESSAAIGTHDLRLVLPRVGGVRVVLQLDAHVPASNLLVRLRHPTADQRPLFLRPLRPGVGGKRPFARKNVPVGVYKLEVVAADAETPPLLTLGGVAIVEGQNCSDPRLALVDVRDRLRHIDVRLRRPDGRPIGIFDYADATVVVRTPHGDDLSPHPRLRQSKVIITTPHPYVDLRLELERYHVIELEFLRASRVVTLQER